MGLTAQIAAALPEAIAGWGLLATPFGGVFRADFAICAVALFVLDHACSIASRLLR